MKEIKIQRNRKRNRKRQSSLEFGSRKQKKKINKAVLFRSIRNWAILVLIALVAGYSLVTFIGQTVKVIGPSMSGTLKDGQTVIVDKLTYRFNDIERFDIIIYKKVDSDKYYDIKRVIGLPNETIQIKDGRVYINDKELTGVPFDEKILTPGRAEDAIVLGENEYFLLGDNVNNSQDSRYVNIGNILENEIYGKVVYILSPNEVRGKIDY